MSYFEYGRDNIAQVPREALGVLRQIISVAQSRIENEIDELRQQGERQVAEALNAAQAGGAGDGGINIGVWIAIAVVIIVALIMLGMIRRNIRNSADGDSDTVENPLFEDQFAVHDEEIEIVTEQDEDLQRTIMDDDDEDNVGIEEPEPAFAFSSATSELPETQASIEDHAVQDIVDHPDEEEVLPEDLQTVFDDNENVIRLQNRAEQQDLEEDPLDDDSVSSDLPEDDLDEAVANENAYSKQPVPEETEQEDAKVRYAFASTPRTPIAFSGISDDDTGNFQETDPDTARARPYIAPTVLREDMEKLEQHQAAHIGDLRDEMTRQISALKAENNNRLDLIINALDRKIENLAETTRQSQHESIQPIAKLTPEVTNKITTLQSTLDNQGQRIRAITQILDDRLDSVSHVYGEVRNIGERFDSFDDKLSKLEQSLIDRAHQDVMADVQLSDVIRSSLSPGDYEFKALLSNNNRADCLIRLPHPPGAIVIDTKFPLDAFSALPGREDVARGTPQAKAAEDAFRRSVLRHIIDVAERFIVPGETADSALLFLPTESIYTTLHARFPDLVRDSFRARVWIVSPSTLMGTLQTLRGVLRDNRGTQSAETVKRETQEVMSEMESLRSRASLLAQNFEKTQSELRSLLDATNKVMSRGTPQQGQGTAPPHNTLMDQLYDNKPEWPGTPADENRDRERREPQSPSLYDDKNARPDNLR